MISRPCAVFVGPSDRSVGRYLARPPGIRTRSRCRRQHEDRRISAEGSGGPRAQAPTTVPPPPRLRSNVGGLAPSLRDQRVQPPYGIVALEFRGSWSIALDTIVRLRFAMALDPATRWMLSQRALVGESIQSLEQALPCRQITASSSAASAAIALDGVGSQ